LVICPYPGPLVNRIKEINARVCIVPKLRTFSTSTFIFGIKVFNPFATLYNLLTLYPTAKILADFLKKEKIYILHTNSMIAHFYGGLAARMAKVKCIWHMQDIVDSKLAFGFVKKAINLIAERLPDKIIVVSNAVKKTFTIRSKEKIAVIYNGVDLNQFEPKIRGHDIRREINALEKDIVVGIVGRIVSWKGHLEFLKAAKFINQKMSDFKFLIVGDASFGEKSFYNFLRNFTKKNNLNNKVFYTGFRKDVPQIIAAMDICVHASNSPDPCPLVLFEYMAAGKPLIATAGGGVPEIVENKKNGILIPMGDWVALANAIIRLGSNIEERVRLGRSARAKIEKFFSIDIFVEKMSEEYIKLASE
jgi:glycosyltransferase involved in cell wall biosynthesis